MLSPVGPEPPRIYWVRRLLVLVSALLVVALIVAGVKAVFSQSDAALATSTAPVPVTPAPSVAESQPASSAASAPASKSAAPVASTSPSASATSQVKACDPSTLHLAITGPATVRAGQSATLDVGITNGSPAACTLNAVASGFEVRVYSGTDRIWSTLDCPTGVPQRQVTLQAAKAQLLEFAWPAQRSASGCKLTDNLRAGTYVATVDIDGSQAAQHVMTISAG